MKTQRNKRKKKKSNQNEKKMKKITQKNTHSTACIEPFRLFFFVFSCQCLRSADVLTTYLYMYKRSGIVCVRSTLFDVPGELSNYCVSVSQLATQHRTEFVVLLVVDVVLFFQHNTFFLSEY